MKKLFIVSIILSTSAFAELRKPRMSENDLLSRVDKIEKNMAILYKQMSLEHKSSSNRNTVTSSGEYELEEKIQVYAEQIKSLRGEVEQLQFENNKLNDKLQKFTEDTEFRFKELEDSKKITIPDTNENKVNKDQNINNDNKTKQLELSTQETKPAATPDEQYKIAYETFQNGDKAKSMKLFEDFISKHPNHKMIASAYYWQAENLLDKKSYNEAALKYYKAYQKSPKGAKAADSLYKLSETLTFAKKNKEACITLNKLKKEFPAANPALRNKIDKSISALKCDT